jgi:acyl-CoA thioester hydrolase
MEKIIFEIPIDSSHIDYSGNASNRHYFDWMEIGRAKLFERLGLPLNEIANSEVVPVLTSTHIDYKEPLLLGDCVLVEGWITDLKRISAVMQFRFYKEQSLVASGYQKGTWVNRTTRRLVRIPQEVRDRFKTFLENAA